MASEVEALALAKSLCDVLDSVRGERDEKYEDTIKRLVESHDKLLQCLTAAVTALGGGIKLHAAQLEAAAHATLSFKVEQPFVEVYVKPPAEKVNGRVVLADSLTGLPPPPGSKQ